MYRILGEMLRGGGGGEKDNNCGTTTSENYALVKNTLVGKELCMRRGEALGVMGTGGKRFRSHSTPKYTGYTYRPSA